MKSASVMRTGTSRVCLAPLTVTVMVRFSLMLPPNSVLAVPRRVVGEAGCLFQRAPRQHRGKVLPIVRRGMDVGHRLDAPAPFAGLAEQLARRRLAGDRLLDFGGAHWRDRDAAHRDRGARNLAAVDH